MVVRDGNAKDVVMWTTKVTGFSCCRGYRCEIEMLSSCLYMKLFEGSVQRGSMMLPFRLIESGRLSMPMMPGASGCRAHTFVYVDLVDADTDPEIARTLFDRVAEAAERGLIRVYADFRIAQNSAQVPGK